MAKGKSKITPEKTISNSDAASGASYRKRYEWDWDTASVTPKSVQGNTPAILQQIEVAQEGDKLVAHIPTLAVGASFQLPQIGGVTTNDEDKFASWEPYSDNSDGKSDMRKAIGWWKRDPLVFRCVKVLTQLANSRFTIQSENEEVQTLFQSWFKQTQPHSFRQAWFTEFFRTCMVPVLKQLIPYVPREYRKKKIPKSSEKDGNVQLAVANKSELKNRLDDAAHAFEIAKDMYNKDLCGSERLEKYRSALAQMQHEWEEGMIAGSYTVLDPLCITIKGPKEMAWLKAPWLTIGDDLREAVRNPTPSQREMILKMPSEIVGQIRNGAKEIWLPPNVCQMVFCDKQPYETYPTPLVSHAFEALDLKYSMMAMDKATASATKNRILKVTIGNDQYPEFDQEKMRHLAKLFLSPTRNLTLFWNHTLQLEWIEPKNDLLTDDSKLNPWNDEIRTAYGISPILTGTSDRAGAIGNSIMNFKGVQEEVTEAQEAYTEFFNRETQLLKMSLGISDEVKGSFDNLNLKDEIKFMATVERFVQNGLLDEQTALENIGYHFPTVLRRMEKMKEHKKKGLFEPKQSGANSSGKKGGFPTGGKPSGQPDADNNDNKSGQSQPKLVAAKVIPISNSEAVLVVGDKISPQDREELSMTFMVSQDSILTTAEYEQKFGGKPDMGMPWPSLGNAEMVDCAMELTKATEAIQSDFLTRLADFKSKGENPDGRSKYLTKGIKAQIMQQSVADYVKTQVPKGVEPELWTSRLDEVKKELCTGGQNLSDDARGIMATLILAKMYGKSRKKKAPTKKTKKK